MRKKIFFSIIFILFSSAICLFLVNEYLKMVEQKIISVHLNMLKKEASSYGLDISPSKVSCVGLIKHKCQIKEVDVQDKIKLQDITIWVTDLSNDKIVIGVKIDKITNNITNPYAIFIPNKFIYYLSLEKQDSKLGYAYLDRKVQAVFDKFSVDANLNILVRDVRFRNENILIMLKEWFDINSPNFYEYSLEHLSFNIQADDINNFYIKYFSKFHKSLHNVVKGTRDIINNGNFENNTTKAIIDNLQKAYFDLLSSKTKRINLNVERKNNNVVFFNLLTKEKTIKRLIEIEQIIDSINEAYRYKLDVK